MQQLKENLLMDLALRFSGKLLLKQELKIDEMTFQWLLEKSLLKKTAGIIKYIGFYECQRCFNQSNKYFGKLPQGSVYCKKCIMMGRVSENEPLYEWIGLTPKPKMINNPSQWEGELTPLQQHASTQLVKTIDENKSLLIHAVCGAGKTEMLYEGVAHAIQQGKRVCIATPRTDVVRELAPRFRRDFPHISSSALYADSTEKDQYSNLVISTTHQLLRYKNAFDVTIIDEVDAFPYHNDYTLPKAVKRAKKEISALIYLTATPRTLLKYQSTLKLIPSVSIPLRFHGHPLPVPQFQFIYKLEKQLNNDMIPQKLKNWLKNRKRRYLLFAPTIDLAKKLSELLDDIPYVYAESPNRKELIQQFREQKLNALITTTILERGVTFPSIDVGVILADHHVFDEAALVQIAGRAGRSASDPTGEVTFFYESKTRTMVKARKYCLKKNKEAEKWKET